MSWNKNISKLLEKHSGKCKLHRIYKIVNKIDGMIYIGSTSQSLRCRFEGHKCDARNGNEKDISDHMRKIGIDNFRIILINEFFCSSKTSKLLELIEYWKYDKNILLNYFIPYSHSHHHTRDRTKLLEKKRREYNRNKENPEWLEKERERNKLRMREKRRLKKIAQETATETERQ